MIAPRGPLRLLRHVGSRPRLWEEAGFTLIEVLVAMVILVVGLLGLLGMLDTAEKASATTRAREGATNLVRQLLEDARTIPYAQIIPTSIEGQIQAMNGLSDASSSTPGWQIDRRGFVYTVTVEECAIDNPKDGLAKTHGSTFCPEQPEWKTGGVEDTEPEDLKRITAKVSWTIQKHTSTVEQVFTMTAAGQAVGLLATKLELISPTVTPSTAPVIGAAYATTPTLTFSVSFQEGATAIIWSLEGAQQEEKTVLTSATSATFNWTIEHVSDGTYEISAQTVNSTGVIGPPISIRVRLIRGTPKAPGEVVGGFDTVYKAGAATEVGELQWKADSERDVIGYRVYGPSKELICPESSETLSTATSCTDFDFSNPAPSERAYSVVALYRNAAEEVKESSPGEVTVKRSESIAPSPPTNLVATTNANGSATLQWTAPTTGTAPSFYRIYRGSKEYASRYGTIFSTECTTECSFTDANLETTAEYWVTAVSSKLVESAFAGPVTG